MQADDKFQKIFKLYTELTADEKKYFKQLFQNDSKDGGKIKTLGLSKIGVLILFIIFVFSIAIALFIVRSAPA